VPALASIIGLPLALDSASAAALGFGLGEPTSLA
jgi:hypothetical protein